MSQKKISIIIPTYNEAQNLPFLAEEIFNTIDKSQIDVELIIVDDNSPDGTGQVAEELKKKYPVQVIHRSGKLGLGSAVREGFERSDRQYLGVMDADLSHDPAILNELIVSLAENDIAMGGRFSEGSHVESWQWWRKMLSNVGVFFANKLTGVKDPLSGYFFINRDVISGVNLKTKGYKILLEILVKGKYAKVKELAYKFRIRKFSTSKLNYKEYFLFFGQLFSYSFYKFFKINKNNYPFILLVGLSLFLLFYRISARAFWGDEQMVLVYLHQTPNPFNFLIDYFKVPDNHAPLYYFFVIAVYKIFPFGEIGIRLISALSGLGIVITVYYFAVLLFKYKTLALWSMFLTLISSYFVLISQMARYHSLTALFMLLSLYFFCKVVLSGYDKKSFIKFLVFTVLVGYTDLPHFIYLIFITNIYYLYSFLRKNTLVISLRKWFGGQAVLGLSFLPIVYLFYLRVFDQKDGGFEKTSLLGKSFLDWASDFLMHFYAYFFGENILPWNWWMPFGIGVLTMLILLFILIKNIYKKSLSKEFGLLFYLFFSSIIANTIFLNYANPRYNFIVYPKYVFVAFPLFIILITALVFTIKSYYKYIILSSIIIVQIVGLFNFYQSKDYFNGSYFNDFKGYEFVRENAEIGDYLLITGDMNIGAFNFYKDKYFSKLTTTSAANLPELLKREEKLRVWFFAAGSDGDSAYSSVTAEGKIPNGFKIVNQFHSVPTDPILLKLKRRVTDRESYDFKYGVYLLNNK